MALKAILESLDDVPEALRGEYQEKDGVFILAVEGIDAHPAVKNLKTAHERQKSENKQLKEKIAEQDQRLEAFGELTVEELEDLRRQAAAGNKKAPTKEELDAMVEERFKIARAKDQAQIEALSKERDEFKAKYEQTSAALSQERIETKIREAAVKAGVRPKAVGIVTDMSKGVWRLDENGVPVAYKGDEPMIGSTGPVTMEEWIGSLKSEHDYLFEPNSGGGATGGNPARRPDGIRVIKDVASADDITAIATGQAVRAV